MTVKTSKKMGAVCGPFERPLGVHSSSAAVRVPPVCTSERHDSRGHHSKVKDASVMSYPPTPNWGQCSPEGTCPAGIRENSMQFQISGLLTEHLQCLCPLLPICAKCQGNKPVFLLRGLTSCANFVQTGPFLSFSVNLFSEVFEVVLVKFSSKLLVFRFKKDKGSLGWCWGS